MKKINIIKESKDFDRIIKNNKAYKYKDYIIFVEYNTNCAYKFGISVGKKIGNAVRRNKVKRQIKYIIDQKYYQNNFNCIIIVRKSILEKTFQEMQDELFELVKIMNITKEN